MASTSLISSTSNPRIQRARKLKRKADRDDSGTFLIESVTTLESAVGAGLAIHETYVDVDATEASAACDALGLDVTPVASHVLKALADTSSPQGVVAIAAQPTFSLDALDPSATLVLVLAEVGDPGNAGTLVRSAAAAGADAVVFTSGGVDPFAPKTVRSSAGALFATPIARSVALEDAVGTLAERGMKIYLAEASKGSAASEVDLSQPVAFVVGNEAHGLPQLDGSSGEFVSIPMPGGTESLNVAVAGSILLYETVRQRHGAGG